MQRVLCIGSSSKDIFFPTDEGVILHTPDDLRSQTKVAFELGGKIRAKDRYEAVGGVAANVAQGLSKLGLSAALYSKVGRDDLGDWIKKRLVAAGVDTECLESDQTVQSDLSAIVVIEKTGDRIIFHNRDANEKLAILPEQLHGFSWFYVSALNGPWKENLKRILDIAAREHIKIALNPGQHNLKSAPKLILDALQYVDALFLNKDEALELLLESGLEKRKEKLNDEASLLMALYQCGPKTIALTDGKRGAWAYDGKELWQAEIYEPHGVVDTTGAGDAFGSGFFSALLYGQSLETALRFGIANGGSVVGYYGASEGLLDQEEMRESIPKVRVRQLGPNVILKEKPRV